MAARWVDFDDLGATPGGNGAESENCRVAGVEWVAGVVRQGQAGGDLRGAGAVRHGSHLERVFDRRRLTIALTCDHVAIAVTVTRVTMPPSEVPILISRDGEWALRQERELVAGRRYHRHLELWRLEAGSWVRQPGTWTSIDTLPRVVRALFELE